MKLDDGYYNVDTTWDDTNPNTYDYFNCSDADYSKNHVRRELSVYLPPCNGTKYRNLEENTQPEQDNNTQDIVYVGYVTPTQTTTPSQSTTKRTSTTTRMMTIMSAPWDNTWNLVDNDKRVLLGEKDEYEPLCRECYQKAILNEKL